MFHLRINQVIGFYKQNVWKAPLDSDILTKMQVIELYLSLKCHSST